MLVIANVIQFWLFLVFVIPSILCSIFTIYHLLMNRTLRNALNNHVVIIILILSLIFDLTDVVWLIDYFRTGTASLSTYAFCLIWTYMDFSLFATVIILVAWASIERHILIFHKRLVATRMKRFVFHYLPMSIFTIYPLSYYFAMFYILPCNITPDYTQSRCGLAYCAFSSASNGKWNGIANNIVPIFIIVMFNLALIARIWYTKYRTGQRFQWKNYRKLAGQLLAISSIFFIFIFPPMLLYTAYSIGLPFDFATDYYIVSLFLTYFGALLVPVVCAVSLSELRTKLWNTFRIFHRPRVHMVPQILLVNHPRDNQIVRETQFGS
ncbi:unnamed protein product [Adineta ricciae]|uniref:G-protein coupled receptors family 1 profile domain-containing protein n=1 Tax=Adineta ricciae TaxID=249248 RepID=A0A814V4V9_ADIRI|nr:unnamed protein product [Adineta ricciae]CAF1200692.1 unnamed protein product [Adineta ricciae]